MAHRLIGIVTTVTAAAVLLGGAALAAQKPVSVSEAITKTFTIEAIDHTLRVVSLKDAEGNIEEVVCGPEVVRFDALKVGDRVTFRYYESLVSTIRRPGQDARPMASGGITRTPGARPGGTISEQTTAMVVIQAIDLKAPSVGVKLDDGRQMSFRAESANNLAGYKVGDTVEITYTRALAVSVRPPGN